MELCNFKLPDLSSLNVNFYMLPDMIQRHFVIFIHPFIFHLIQ